MQRPGQSQTDQAEGTDQGPDVSGQNAQGDPGSQDPDDDAEEGDNGIGLFPSLEGPAQEGADEPDQNPGHGDNTEDHEKFWEIAVQSIPERFQCPTRLFGRGLAKGFGGLLFWVLPLRRQILIWFGRDRGDGFRCRIVFFGINGETGFPRSDQHKKKTGDGHRKQCGLPKKP